MPAETSAQTDILLIGGGAIGLLSAIKLAEAGLRRITVLDQGHIGQEASWAGGGILSPLYPWRYPLPYCVSRCEETGVHLDIIPVRGQMLLLQGKPGVLNTMLMRDNHSTS
ncbi:FAD-dependent oxidoreductase [Acidithiobacillus sp.]|jgi:glycine/D-amino acid oxidase-like deaminating enzyme|nr:FAD-dependent oxidoreductase [Acidithiobacillus sp.]